MFLLAVINRLGKLCVCYHSNLGVRVFVGKNVFGVKNVFWCKKCFWLKNCISFYANIYWKISKVWRKKSCWRKKCFRRKNVFGVKQFLCKLVELPLYCVPCLYTLYNILKEWYASVRPVLRPNSCTSTVLLRLTYFELFTSVRFSSNKKSRTDAYPEIRVPKNITFVLILMAVKIWLFSAVKICSLTFFRLTLLSVYVP